MKAFVMYDEVMNKKGKVIKIKDVMVDRKKEERRTGGRWNLDDDFYDSDGGNK